MTLKIPDFPAASGWPQMRPGEVWLVGAGPGDAGLLTLHALNALRQAEVVVHDALVGSAVLEWAPQAEKIYAGKRGGKPSPSQTDISLQLISLAKSGRKVLRLKGGDPFVFGRGGEEAAALLGAGISVRVVPGISAGIGGLASAGIPVTHRDVNQSVTFITGHDQTGDAPGGLNWKAISEGSEVLVIYMAMKHLGLICSRLIAAGRSPDEPVAIVASASLPTQQVLETTLASAVEDAAKGGIQPPAIICVGRVIHLRGVTGLIGLPE